MTDDELLERMDRSLERSSVALERNADMFELLTHAFAQLVKAVNRMDRTVAGLLRDSQDSREQLAANTQAVLRLIDRLGPEPGASA